MIVCCGEALIDMLPGLSQEGKAVLAPHAGGALFNTSIALGRLGVPVEFFTGLSTDLFGHQLRDALAASDVGLRYADFSTRPTTLAFAHIVDGQATYTFYDEGTAGRMLTTAELPVLEDDVAAMLFGAVSLISEPCGSTYEALMDREASHRVTMLDPNIRPAFITDRKAYIERFRRMMAKADIVKLSDEDLAWFGEEGSMEEIVGRWLERGPKLVIVTRGSQGAIGYTRQFSVSVAPPRVTVVDTVGAGDTFNAGVLAALHEQGALRKDAIARLTPEAVDDALHLGARAAAVTVSRAGADPPWKHELS